MFHHIVSVHENSESNDGTETFKREYDRIQFQSSSEYTDNSNRENTFTPIAPNPERDDCFEQGKRRMDLKRKHESVSSVASVESMSEGSQNEIETEKPQATKRKCRGKSCCKSYKTIKKCRYEKFKSYFQELKNMLPSKHSKSTQKTILLDTVAYIKALEIELGLINEQTFSWEEHYKALWDVMIQNEAGDDGVINEEEDET